MFDEDDTHPLNGEELRTAATENIIARSKEMTERMNRAASAIHK